MIYNVFKARDDSLCVLENDGRCFERVTVNWTARGVSCDSELHGALSVVTFNVSPYHNHRLTRYTMFNHSKSITVTGGSITQVHGNASTHNSYGKIPIYNGVVC